MHRQSWFDQTCPHCGLTTKARRTTPGKPLHYRSHFDPEGFLCPPAPKFRKSAMTVPPFPAPQRKEWPGQGRLFDVA